VKIPEEIKIVTEIIQRLGTKLIQYKYKNSMGIKEGRSRNLPVQR